MGCGQVNLHIAAWHAVQMVRHRLSERQQVPVRDQPGSWHGQRDEWRAIQTQAIPEFAVVSLPLTEQLMLQAVQTISQRAPAWQ